jgi:hypothetical protein
LEHAGETIRLESPPAIAMRRVSSAIAFSSQFISFPNAILLHEPRDRWWQGPPPSHAEAAAR